MAGGLVWFVIGWLALIGQVALAIPTLVVGSNLGGGLVGVALALAWGLATVVTAWSWLLGRWRVVVGPILFGSILLLVSTPGS